MTRRKGDISQDRFACYIYNGNTSIGPFYKGQRFGKAIAYKELTQVTAALRWLNDPTRKLLPRVLVHKAMSPISGCYQSIGGGGQWLANTTATL